MLFASACNSQNKKIDTYSNNNLKYRIELQEKAKYPDIKSIPLPEGYHRIKLDSGSFGFWLGNVKLKTENNKLRLYDGSLKYNQDLHFAVLKFDVGKRDLQQCADAVMRLRAEYLYAQENYESIHFNFLSDGKPHYYISYAGNDRSYKTFRNYMNYIFSYANTSSLKKELTPVSNPEKNIKPGDVFIQSGKPYGHAVIVVDAAKNDKGQIIFMLAQSYMPAQEIHIVKNLNNPDISPWYNFTDTENLKIPEWQFKYSDLRRF